VSDPARWPVHHACPATREPAHFGAPGCSNGSIIGCHRALGDDNDGTDPFRCDNGRSQRSSAFRRVDAIAGLHHRGGSGVGGHPGPIAVAVRANWGLAKRLPQWLVTVFLIVIGVLVLVAFVAHTAWIGIAALIAVFATWLWFLARWLFPRMPEGAGSAWRGPETPSSPPNRTLSARVSAQRGADLEHVLDDVVRRSTPKTSRRSRRTEPRRRGPPRRPRASPTLDTNVV